MPVMSRETTRAPADDRAIHAHEGLAHKQRQSLGSTRVLLALLLCLTTWTVALWSRFG
jgi:hypothetical protein